MASEAVAGETPQTEKRSLRPRKRSDVATDPQESEEELPQGKRRRSSARSTNGKKKQIGDTVEADADVSAAANGNGHGRSGQKQSNKADNVAAEAKKNKSKGKSARSVKAKGKPVPDGAKTKKVKKHRTVVTGDVVGLDLENDDEVACQEEEEDEEEEHVIEVKSRVAQPRRVLNKKDKKEEASEVFFEGDSLPDSEAKKRWPCRYSRKGAGSNNNANNGAEAEEETKAKSHYLKAKVDNVIYDLGDDVYVKASEGVKNYIGKIIEIFEGTDKKKYFTAQWYFRAEDTVIKAKCAQDIDPRRVFLSEEKNDNDLECIVSKVKIVRVKPNINLEEKSKSIPECDLYYDMSYDVIYSSFANLPPRSKDEEKDDVDSGASSSEIISSESNINKENGKSGAFPPEKKSLTLLDLYSGCGGMSTGLCLGAALAGVNLQTLWAVDLNKFACDSLQLNHPKTQVRNEKAENFLKLLKEWEKLCEQYNVKNEHSVYAPGDSEESDDEEEDSEPLADDEFEVQKLMGICWGDPTQLGHEGLRFLVRWKGYGPQHDTWEPVDGLSSAQERIKEFVVSGYKRNILPLPGTADVICGGPPCQGASGFNRFRNKQNPLADEKNQQMIVYMDIVEYLKPKFVLMENVVDILRFSEGFLGRYALSRLVNMNYQARLGLMVAGCYGLGQYRMRVFLWGALPTEDLPQFPLPTHDVIPRGNVPLEFEHHIVALEANADRSGLKRALVLEDVISDLPPVTNYEERTEMDYGADPRTNFQCYIRLSRGDMLDYSYRGENEPEYKLFDHQPLKLSMDDYQRVCQIPKRKGANFRDLKGVKVRPDKTCYIDPDIPRPLLPSGKPLCPDYAISFIRGKSLKPFGRLWWDQTVATVVTRAEPHNQIILHPIQDRVLTIRENARLQGFPDYYRLSGPVKQRYIQVGNAVAVPVGRALGVALGRAACRVSGRAEGPVFTLPLTFTDILPTQPGTPSEVAN